MAFISIDSIFQFLRIIFRAPRKSHEPEIETPKFWGYVMLAQKFAPSIEKLSRRYVKRQTAKMKLLPSLQLFVQYSEIIFMGE